MGPMGKGDHLYLFTYISLWMQGLMPIRSYRAPCLGDLLFQKIGPARKAWHLKG